MGDPAYDGGILLKSRALTLLEADDLRKAVHRVLDVFAEAAELDRELAQRWARFHAVQAALSAVQPLPTSDTETHSARRGATHWGRFACTAAVCVPSPKAAARARSPGTSMSSRAPATPECAIS